MPYLPFSDQEEQRKKAGQDQVNISGGSNVLNQAAQSVAPTPKPVANSGSWTNLNAYLDANKDNAANLGNTISQNITTQGNQVRSGIQSASDDFNSQVDKGLISNLSNAKQDASDIVKQAREANQANQINDSNVDRFKEISNASYKGPNSLDASQYYQDTQSNLNKANEYKSNANSDVGRFSLLQEMFDRPSYTQGQKNLDNLLLSGNQDAKNSIQGAASSLNDLQEQWDKANSDATALASNRSSEMNDIRQFAQDELANNRSARAGEVDSSLQDLQNKWSDEFNHYNDILSSYQGGDLNLTKDEASKLGVLRRVVQDPTGVFQKATQEAPIQYANTQLFNVLNGVSPSTYLDLAAYDPSKVISKDQFAQLAALDKLANQYGLASSSKFGDADQAGTLSLENNFNASRFGKAADAAQNAFNDYAKGANFTGTGTATEGYQSSYLTRDEETRTANLAANLAQLLKKGGYKADPESGEYTNQFLAPGVINELVGNIGGDVGDLINDLIGNDRENAIKTASYWANKRAQDDLYAKIQAALNAQGYNNKVNVR